MQLVADSLDKGWKTWSAQATEWQLLRADRENKKAQGHEFFKMTEEAIFTVQEEITWLMDEFDAHDIDTSVKLDKYERN